MSTIETSSAFQLKGSLFTLTILQLQKLDYSLFTQQLQKTIAQAPKFFQFAPIVIDLQKLDGVNQAINFSELKSVLQQHQLVPVGICNGNEQQQQDAINAGLAILPNAKNSHEFEPPAIPVRQMQKPTKEVMADYPGARIITQPIRSGQQIYAKECDLIVLSSVGYGAELLADGNIHVYGTLRGRALAGIRGNKEARIFCKTLDAELVSIAGLYRLSEDFTPSDGESGYTQIYLENDKLLIGGL
jgi:septum site-determining protein MinC